jgi:hypothetical protein
MTEKKTRVHLTDRQMELVCNALCTASAEAHHMAEKVACGQVERLKRADMHRFLALEAELDELIEKFFREDGAEA